jgi:hypothetical protein
MGQFRSREQRREDRTSLFGQPLARRHLIALDQAADDHLLRRGVRDAGRLPAPPRNSRATSSGSRRSVSPRPTNW